MTNQNNSSIRYMSRCLRFGCIAGMVLVPILTACYWINDGFRIMSIPRTNWYIQFADAPFTSIDVLSPFLKFVGFLVDLIPCSFFMISLYLLIKLFKLYERLEFFSKNNVRYIRQIGLVLILGQLVHPFYIALHSFILTIASPAGQRVIILAYGPNQLKTLFLAFIIFLAAQIMEEGRHLQEEYSNTI